MVRFTEKECPCVGIRGVRMLGEAPLYPPSKNRPELRGQERKKLRCVHDAQDGGRHERVKARAKSPVSSRIRHNAICPVTSERARKARRMLARQPTSGIKVRAKFMACSASPCSNGPPAARRSAYASCAGLISQAITSCSLASRSAVAPADAMQNTRSFP